GSCQILDVALMAGRCDPSCAQYWPLLSRAVSSRLVETLLLRIHPAASRVKLLSAQAPASFVAWGLYLVQLNLANVVGCVSLCSCGGSECRFSGSWRLADGVSTRSAVSRSVNRVATVARSVSSRASRSLTFVLSADLVQYRGCCAWNGGLL